MDAWENMINSVSTLPLSSGDDPARWAVTKQDIRSYLYCRWYGRVRSMPESPEQTEFMDRCGAVLLRNNTRETITYLSERDMMIISRDKFIKKQDRRERKPLTYEEAVALCEAND